MEGLANYGSDDDYEDSPKLKKETQEKHGRSHGTSPKATDVNYEEVGMDLSEDSDRSDKARSPERKSGHLSPRSSKRRRSDDEDDTYNKYQHKQRDNYRNDSKYRNKNSYERNKERDDKNRDYDRNNRDRHYDDGKDRDDKYKYNIDEHNDKLKDYEEKYKDRDDKYKCNNDKYNIDKHNDKLKDYDEKYKERDDKYKNRDDKYKDHGSRYKERDDGRYKDRDDKHRGRDREDRDRFKDDRRTKRSNSHEKARSRSPRRNRRSGSKERGGKYTRRFDKASNKMAHLEKMGIELKSDGSKYEDDQKGAGGENKFFLPGISGRLREQMERRKLLWQKKDPEQVAPIPSAAEASGSKTEKVWEATTFAQDQDGKQASKFKRLMGIKDSSGNDGKSHSDIVKKQEELFSTMEQQYEVARTATHTMRGVGLGFGSFQR